MFRRGLFVRPGTRGLVIGALIGVIACLSTRSGLLRQAEEWLQDGCFAWRSGLGVVRTPTENIILVSIDDDRSTTLLSRPLVYCSPEVGRTVRALRGMGAAAIGIDFMIDGDCRGYGGLDAGAEGDPGSLAQAINEGVVLPMKLEPQPGVDPKLETADGRFPVEQWKPDLERSWADQPAKIGFLNLDVDSDLFLRTTRLTSGGEHGRRWPSFALALTMVAKGWPIEVNEGGLTLKGRRVPLEDGRLRVNYLGPAGRFPVVSMADVLENRIPSGISFDKAIVIIGACSPEQRDYHATPFSNTYWGGAGDWRRRPMSGGEVHANIVATLTDRDYLRRAPESVTIGVTIAIAGLQGGALARMTLVNGLIVAIAHHFLWKGVCISSFAYFGLRLEILPMLLSGMLVYGVIFIARWWTLRRMMGIVQSEAVARLLENDPSVLGRLGVERSVSVLFADIRGFTTFSEAHSARQVVELLNDYYGVIVPIIERHGGMLNHYLGDGLMATFGLPPRDELHSARAVRAGRSIIEAIQSRRQHWENLGFPELSAGVGVHSGRAILGMIGSRDRLEYTAIGDTINTASRIQTQTRPLAVNMLISAETWRELSPAERLELGCEDSPESLQVKGKLSAVNVHRVRV
jgi:adenylate cyclase